MQFTRAYSAARDRDLEVGMLCATAAGKQSCLVPDSVRDQSQVSEDPRGRTGRSAGKREGNRRTRVKTSACIRRRRQRRDLAGRKDTRSPLAQSSPAPPCAPTGYGVTRQSCSRGAYTLSPAHPECTTMWVVT